MSSPLLGEIRMFAGNFAPRGWAFCNGQILSIAQNTALFSILGTTYGGNGQTTFALPDFRGRVPMGHGQGPGLTNRTLGEQSGQEAVTLLASQMPAHNHLVQCNSNPGEAITPANNILAGAAAGARRGPFTANVANATLRTDALNVVGGSQPHDNMQPYLVVSFIIALEGIFPSRN